MMQIRDELCVLRWRSNGSFKAPAVLRVAIGGYSPAVALSQPERRIHFHALPGLRGGHAVLRA